MTDSTAPIAAEDVLDAEEIAALRDAVRGVTASLWPRAAQPGDLAALWEAAAAQGWLGFADPAYTPAALAVQAELGGIACPLPIVDAALVARLLLARGETDRADAVEAGVVRPVIALGSVTDDGVSARHIEAASAATHLLVVDQDRAQLALVDLTTARIDALPGLPLPAWSCVTGASPLWTASLTEAGDLVAERRLALAARALAAAARAHEQAREHAQTRTQFGRAIGGFQAVSHRLVNVQISLTAAEELLDRAERLHRTQDPAADLALEVAVDFLAARLPGILFDGHHTLAAVGYFDEHDAPWLFRRAHADLAVLAAHRRTTGLGDMLLRDRRRLPEEDRGASAQAIREEVREAFSAWTDGPPSHLHSWDDDARAVLRDRGWIGVGWPAEVGGGGWPVADVLAFSEALAYANPPLGNIMMGINSIAPMAISVASPPLRDLILAEVRKGDLSIALGYSEPEAGSDLASLRTRATRAEGGWVITGQKMWGTCFPDSRWVVLAARTDPEAERPHAGISLFLVDTDSPGLTISPHTSLGGDVSATSYWDDVFVPDGRLIGEVNQGWSALMTALSAERVLIGASVMRSHRAFDRLVDLIATDPGAVVPNRRPDATAEVARLALRLEGARALVGRAVRGITAGTPSPADAPMAKIAATEFAEDLHSSAIALLGPDALLAWGTPGAVGEGYFEDGMRTSIMGVVAGGTGDIQRNLVARSLGLR